MPHKSSSFYSFFFQLKILFVITGESVGDHEGLLVFSVNFHVVVHEALVAGELGFHSLASSKPIGESTQRFGGDVGVARLLSSVH